MGARAAAQAREAKAALATAVAQVVEATAAEARAEATAVVGWAEATAAEATAEATAEVATAAASVRACAAAAADLAAPVPLAPGGRVAAGWRSPRACVGSRGLWAEWAAPMGRWCTRSKSLQVAHRKARGEFLLEWGHERTCLCCRACQSKRNGR